MVGILVSFWEDLFSGAMLVSGRVNIPYIESVWYSWGLSLLHLQRDKRLSHIRWWRHAKVHMISPEVLGWILNYSLPTD